MKMLVPSSINKNCLKVYEPHGKWVKRYQNKQISSFSIGNLHGKIRKTLRELCVECIAANWTDYPILDEIILVQDRHLLLDILPETLPLELSIPKIDDDNYWKKCFTKRWPKRIPKLNNDVQLNHIVRSSINETNEEYINSIFSHRNVVRIENEHDSGNSKVSSRRTSRKFSLKTDIDKDYEGRTWKKHYCELHVKEYLENLKPEDYNPEKIKELCDLCGSYVEVLKIDEMICSENSCNKIPLNSIITGLPNLKELSLRFKQTYAKDNDFSWNLVNTSYQDVCLFARGLEKIRLKILRVTDSDIDCDKAIAILRALMKHDLDTLDFSHCKIGNRGMMAISRFIIENPVKEIFLGNNRIGSKGINSLAYAMAQKTCKVKMLDLRLNQFFDDAANLLISSIAEYNNTLKYLAISGCGLTEKCAIANAIRMNSPLESLDISNNALGEATGTQILEALKFNTNLKKIDLRMCKLPSLVEASIQTEVYKNRKGITKSVTNDSVADTRIAFDETLIAEMEEVLFIIESNKSTLSSDAVFN